MYVAWWQWKWCIVNLRFMNVEVGRQRQDVAFICLSVFKHGSGVHQQQKCIPRIVYYSFTRFNTQNRRMHILIHILQTNGFNISRNSCTSPYKHPLLRITNTQTHRHACKHNQQNMGISKPGLINSTCAFVYNRE